MRRISHDQRRREGSGYLPEKHEARIRTLQEEPVRSQEDFTTTKIKRTRSGDSSSSAGNGLGAIFGDILRTRGLLWNALLPFTGAAA